MKTNEEQQFDDWKKENNCYYDSCRGWQSGICECNTETLHKAMELHSRAIKSVLNKQKLNEQIGNEPLPNEESDRD